ncbi:MAG: class I SAM-dependent methyltransferase [Anaerolineales bacterium]|nr:class I SAM-dependent methyltransferase [Anaerolineales bacterium]
MVKQRIPETDHGIQGEFTVAMYDKMQRKLRDRGWIETQDLLKYGLDRGCALEVGPGPGYLGLEWLKNTRGTRLKGLDISPDMIAMAEHNAREYGLEDRVEYVLSSGNQMPLDDQTFDMVFTNGSLHEWADPKNTFDEIWRVLKPGGKVFISDMRRDMFVLLRWFLWIGTSPKEIRPGLLSSIDAAYTPDELRALIKGTQLARCMVSENLIGLIVYGEKG